MFRIGPEELILILFIALIFFGPKKLPELGKGMGEAIRGFQKAMQGAKDELERNILDEKKPSTSGPSDPHVH